MISSFCLCYIALTGSVSGSVEVMNLIMLDISPILLFLQELFTYFAQRNAHFFLVPILLKILLAKFINAYSESIIFMKYLLPNIVYILQHK